MPSTRRQILKWGVGLGAIAGVGGGAFLLPPRPSARLDPLPDLALRLFDALDGGEKAEACVAYDHPLRQYHNRGLDTGGIWALKLSREARSILVDLVHAGLSPQGRQRIPSQFFLDWPGVHATNSRPLKPRLQKPSRQPIRSTPTAEFILSMKPSPGPRP